MTKMRLGGPTPNHSNAMGSSAMAGSGLNIDVNGPRASLPQRDKAARVVSTAATAIPSA